jgi:glycosyltransferase involved in cell wall biosynthesis
VKIAAICCTLRRPAELRNAVACFIAQDYPADLRELIILDDDPDPGSGWQTQQGDGWRIVRLRERTPNLGAKHNLAASLAAGADAVAVWDDDDVYAPWHLSAHAAALESRAWSAPSEVWSNYFRAAGLKTEDAAGRFHGAWSFRRETLVAVGGWPQTPDLAFDQALGANLQTIGEPGDPCEHAPPSYCYRWNGGNVSAEGPAWSETILERRRPTGRLGNLVPEYDRETVEILRTMTGGA